MQALLLCFAFYALSFLEALARWARGGDVVPFLSRPLHAASPLVHALSAFVAAAFYTCIWPDAAFQAAHVAPKARLRARAACVARHWRRLIRPVAQAQAGLPVAGWMHEVHAGPLLLAALDLAGARDAELPLPRAAPLAGAAAAVAGAYWAALSWAARTAGAWPYEFLGRMSEARRWGFAASSAALLAVLALATRAAALHRAALLAAHAQRLKRE